MFSFRKSKKSLVIIIACLTTSYYTCFIYLFIWCNSHPVGQGLFILDHTQRRTTVGRTSLDVWLAHRRDLYVTTYNTDNRQTSMPPVGFEPTISAAADLRLKPRGHWDRQFTRLLQFFVLITAHKRRNTSTQERLRLWPATPFCSDAFSIPRRILQGVTINIEGLNVMCQLFLLYFNQNWMWLADLKK
jgi:hypothetical protein